MKHIIFIVANLFIFVLSASDYYESNSINTLKVSKSIILPDGSSYTTLDSKGSGTNNLGLYEIFDCAGHRLSKENKLLEQYFYCNVELSNKDFYTFFMKRSETDMDAGVGYIVIAGGSKPFSQIKDSKCNYAVSFFKDQAYVKIKCQVDEKFFKEFN